MKTVLVIDDEQGLLLSVELLLTKEGYKVLTATTGEDGLILAKETRPDVILLDIMMPGIGGLAALKMLRMLPDLKVTPVILMSGVRPLVKQADYKWTVFLSKPFDMRELLRVVDSQL